MIRFAVVGYGNLGRACERIAVSSPEFELVGIFTRRNPLTMSSPFCTKFYLQDDLEKFAEKIDVLALCTGSANDLMSLGHRVAKNFNSVDSFDTHANMREYVETMQQIASESGHLSFVGVGWDPGVFSIMRALFAGLLEDGNTQTFWGKGVSQGHSEAIRKLEGVETGIQYTIPKQEALSKARAGEGSTLSTRDKHLRECFVVAKDGADTGKITEMIETMPNYFAEYDTVVHFISREQFDSEHIEMPHGGFVLRSGDINGKWSSLEFSLKLESNPDFTANVLMSYVLANAKLFAEGFTGAKTVLDIPISALSKLDRLDLIAKMV